MGGGGKAGNVGGCISWGWGGGVISWGWGGGDDVAGGISWGWGGETNGVGRIFQKVVSQCVSCELTVSQSVSQYQGGIIEADRSFDQLKKGKCLTSDRVE